MLLDRGTLSRGVPRDVRAPMVRAYAANDALRAAFGPYRASPASDRHISLSGCMGREWGTDATGRGQDHCQVCAGISGRTDVVAAQRMQAAPGTYCGSLDAPPRSSTRSNAALL